MTENNIFSAKNLKTVAIIALITTILSLVFSFLQTPKFEGTSRMIVVYNQDNMDPYTASRASDYVTNVLSEVVYSNSFIDTVLKSNFEIKNNFGSNPEVREKNWKKMVKVKVKENRGILIVNVLNEDKNQANQITQAITYTLITKHQSYHGAGDKIVIKSIDLPTVSNDWAEPKVTRNTLIGLIAGLMIGLTLIVLFPEQRLLAVSSMATKKIITGDETIEFNTPQVSENYNSTDQTAQTANEDNKLNGELTRWDDPLADLASSETTDSPQNIQKNYLSPQDYL